MKLRAREVWFAVRCRLCSLVSLPLPLSGSRRDSDADVALLLSQVSTGSRAPELWYLSNPPPSTSTQTTR